MKNISKQIFVLVLPLLFIATACHKEGIGGKSSLSGIVNHHEKPIPNSIVYIKYGATDFPGTNVNTYDDHTTADANAKYEFKNLRMGNYYLYGVGWDNSISSTVTGGVGIKLKYNKSYTLDVPVIE
jgi:hypothetical protein